MSLKGRSIQVHDMTLRDGMHPKRHQMSLEQMRHIAQGLDEAGVPLIEVTHGDGLGGSSVNYGFPAHTDEAYLSTVIPLMKQAPELRSTGLKATAPRMKILEIFQLGRNRHMSAEDVFRELLELKQDIGLELVRVANGMRLGQRHLRRPRPEEAIVGAHHRRALAEQLDEIRVFQRPRIVEPVAVGAHRRHDVQEERHAEGARRVLGLRDPVPAREAATA